MIANDLKKKLFFLKGHGTGIGKQLIGGQNSD
jgi:hypothetical protein